MSRKSRRRSHCPINFALEIFGDKWSLLVIRDLMFMGKNSYGEFLQGGEGIATNILADRLGKLEAAQIISKSPDPENGPRVIYSLTERGIDLMPVMIDIIAWSGKYDPQSAVPKVFLKQLTSNKKATINKARKKLQSS